MKTLATVSVAALMMASPALAGEVHMHKDGDIHTNTKAEYSAPAHRNDDKATLYYGEYDTKEQVFAEMDDNNDGRISVKEFQDNTQRDNEYQAFLELDTNKDKVLSKNELLGGDLNDGVEVQAAGETEPEGRKNFYRKAERYELSRTMYGETPQMRKSDRTAMNDPEYYDIEVDMDLNPDWDEYETRRQVFNTMDADKDGQVSRKEFMNKAIHDNEPAVFARLDANSNGYLSKAELYKTQ